MSGHSDRWSGGIRRGSSADMLARREHGNYVTYRTFGCRCGSCREANRDYQRAYRERLREARNI